jgi:hypothetical protein
MNPMYEVIRTGFDVLADLAMKNVAFWAVMLSPNYMALLSRRSTLRSHQGCWLNKQKRYKPANKVVVVKIIMMWVKKFDL